MWSTFALGKLSDNPRVREIINLQCLIRQRKIVRVATIHQPRTCLWVVSHAKLKQTTLNLLKLPESISSQVHKQVILANLLHPAKSPGTGTRNHNYTYERNIILSVHDPIIFSMINKIKLLYSIINLLTRILRQIQFSRNQTVTTFQHNIQCIPTLLAQHLQALAK